MKIISILLIIKLTNNIKKKLGIIFCTVQYTQVNLNFVLFRLGNALGMIGVGSGIAATLGLLQPSQPVSRYISIDTDNRLKMNTIL